ncbi:hypothetical protein Ae201684P_000611 [Aphanomyces euteiches]|uniref:Uncharacterized protein n=1 Tax=Aphanomyces euteiches TaxID=100861 RepID=A0A6G0W7P6_9STRA|nr:hypothetical protein Ae201684_017952 [Aphanomyces euteiches]KAH9087199.1 hypothetical protein Ae201684P_000611 [Aphanomyces euteiches]
MARGISLSFYRPSIVWAKAICSQTLDNLANINKIFQPKVQVSQDTLTSQVSNVHFRAHWNDLECQPAY